ncbi:MAG: MBL fold metallo-hydrolase [Butyricicoccaceae bacterium]
MKITVLVENTSDFLPTRHGLSLYIQTKHHNILFDMGPDETFWSNAEALGIDLSDVDLAFLSHGHYDHGGGLAYFLDHNHTATVYLQKSAFLPHFSKDKESERFIGIDPALEGHPRLVYAGAHEVIDPELQLFAAVTERRLFASSNHTLLMEHGGAHIPDDFSHEQSLIITEGDQHVLIAGCAHCGIVNICDRAEQLCGAPMTHVLSGFHLSNPGRGTSEPEETVRAVGAELAQRPAQYFTCHCTGLPSYERLHSILGDRIHYASAGSVFVI